MNGWEVGFRNGCEDGLWVHFGGYERILVVRLAVETRVLSTVPVRRL